MKQETLSRRSWGKWGMAAAAAALLEGTRRTWMAKREESRSFRGKVVVITGGARGLGLAMARRFADEGACLVICSRTQPQLERARAELEARDATVLAFRCDVSDERQVRELARATLARFGRVDVLINNAGVIQVGPFESMNIDDFSNAMDSIFWGTLKPSLAFQQHLRPGSRIVNITSIGGEVSIPHLLPYSAAKFAARALSEGLRAELAKDGVRVVTVVPGLIRTGSFGNALVKGDRKREMDWFSLSSSLPGITLSADQAAHKVVEACRRGTPFVTLGLPAKGLRLFHAVFPGLSSRLLSVVNRLLPEAPRGARQQKPEKGQAHRDSLSRSPLTALGDRAARDLNEVA